MTIDSLIRAARTAEAKGQAGRTVQLCNLALQQDSACLDSLLLLGSLAARQGRADEAVAFLRRAHDADPKSYDAIRWLTTLLIGRDGGAEAVAFGQLAVRVRPEEADSHVILGLAALGQGNMALAISSLQKGVDLSPETAGAWHNLGIALQFEESFEEAIDAFKHATQLAPDVAESYMHLGRCYLVKEMGDEALDCARRAIELAPESLEARRLLSDSFFSAVHGDNGLNHIQQAVGEDPGASFPHAVLGSRLQEQGDFAKAEASLQRSIELQPAQGFAYYVLSHNRKFREGDRPEIARMEAASQSPSLTLEERQYAHFAMGKAFDDLGDYEAAMRHFELAHEEPDPRVAGLPIQRHSNVVHRYNQLFSKRTLERFSEVANPSAEPIFIFGMPRSGTTLLEQIVSRHSRVGGAGELFFWRDVSRRIVNLSEGALNPKELQKAGAKYLELIRSKAPDKAHVTDKFPSNYVYLGMLHLIFPNATFIHARRNPLDTCLSIYMRPFSTNQGLGRTRRQIVDTYKLYRQSIEAWRQILGPDRFLDVDYEDLVQNPEAMTRKVIAYCGLRWEEACLRPQEGDRRVVTFSKWQVRQPVYTTSVERWRNYEPWLGVFEELVQ